MSGPTKPWKAPRKPEGSIEDTVPNLALEDTTRQLMRGVLSPSAKHQFGVNPYDTFPNTSSSTGTHGTAELRKLSEWIRQKRIAESAAEAEKKQSAADPKNKR